MVLQSLRQATESHSVWLILSSLAFFLCRSSSYFYPRSCPTRIPVSPFQSASLTVPKRPLLPPSALDLPHDVSGK